ncbi:MlaC/ttg2D family ABC transporter substrate-binding protein [Thiomicrospira pelophila]|uniref:MlaC/ttg2D family ABC transporter substrate-binding protein n=1 Tax=Thiomicrospira pelophila TaxID=934 RepID=UPI0004A77AED|nr:ABC transporter substrate-binding protein [Thiomicrospira pelophila]
MRLWKTQIITALFGLALGAGFAIADPIKLNQQDPQEMVVGLSTSVLDEIKARADELSDNPSAIRQFADQNILPYVDTARMARYVVGRYWRTASEQQQQDFVEQFTLTMMRSYSQSILKLNVRSIDVAKPLPDGENRVIVSTKVTQDDGSTAEVTYRIFKEASSGKWLIYDVVVENISLLVNFRQSYATDIERRGFDEVIVAMKERNKSFNEVD